MRSTAAEIAGEPLFDLLQRRMRRLREDGTRGHDHAVSAIATLCGLLGDESGLDGARLFLRAKAFQSGHGAARHLFDGRNARAHGLAIHQHRAGAALAQPAAEFCSLQRKLVAQDVEKRLLRIPGIDCDRAPVNAEFVLRHSIIILPIAASGDAPSTFTS